MTTINCNSKMSNGMTLNGNILSGDTYKAREYIKSYWDGKWDANSKTWTVDGEKVISTITAQEFGFCKVLSLSNEPLPAPVVKTAQHSVRCIKRDGSLAEDY